MNPVQASKLFAATQGALPELLLAMHGSARKCTDLHGNARVNKTNPVPSQQPQQVAPSSTHGTSAAGSNSNRQGSASVHGNARFCTDLHGSARTDKTKPTSGGAAAGQEQDPLAPRQLTAARLLLAGHSIAATARALGVNESTVRRWKSSRQFQQEIHRQSDAEAARAEAERPSVERSAVNRFLEMYGSHLLNR